MILNKEPFMKRLFIVLMMGLTALSGLAQQADPLAQLAADPRKAYGTDYPYSFEQGQMTEAPEGYHPFYISHYGRHGSRYNWSSKLYLNMDTLLTTTHDRQLLTADGEAFYERYMAVREELMTGVGELTQLGWEQHQGIARVMYDSFTDVFKDGGNVFAFSSLSGRCMLSMSAFCQELVQCNPQLEIREQASRFTLDGVVPTDSRNPVKHDYPEGKARFKAHRDTYKGVDMLPGQVLARAFVSTDSLPWDGRKCAYVLIDFYKTLPSIGYEGMMGSLVSDREIADNWETANLGSYEWVSLDKYKIIPVLQDIIGRADEVLSGTSDHLADLRFGHDSCLGPLTVLMGINGADADPEDPYQVKYCYQNWETCKASNVQLVFYRSHDEGEGVLVKCLLNGQEATLPVPTTQAPYYRWADFRNFYLQRCQQVPTAD